MTEALQGVSPSKKARKYPRSLLVAPHLIDWDDDASIDAWAQQVWLHAVAKREQSEKQQAEQQKGG